jgi:hypothetical protein
VTDYLGALVARGIGRVPGPVLSPRLAPEIVAARGWQARALPPVEPVSEAAVVVPERHEPARSVHPSSREISFAESSPAVRQLPRDRRRAEAPPGRRRTPSAEPPPARGDAAPETIAPRIDQATAHSEARAGDAGVEPSPAPATATPSRPVAEPVTARPTVPEHDAAPPRVAPTPVRDAEPLLPEQTAEPPAPRPRVALLPREPENRPDVPTAAVSTTPRVEVRIGRVEVRAPRAPERWRPVDAAPVHVQPAPDPFAGFAAARRYVDRTWR